MSRRIRAVSLAAAALASPAFAQSPAEGGEMTAPDTAPPSAVTPSGEPGQINTDGVYTIKKGDTLWDLSQKFLSNPWYWPKIWADNPGVENPHWIYPGNGLKIRSGGEALPGEASPVAGAEAEPAEEATPDEGEPVERPPKNEVADFTTGTLDKADNLGQDNDLVTISGKRQLAMLAGGPTRAQTSAIITAGELEQKGIVSASFEQKELLARFDRVYLEFKDPGAVKIGERFSVFRTAHEGNGTLREIIHPTTHASVGFMTEILATVEIVAKEGKRHVGEVVECVDYIMRGDRLGPPVKLDKSVQAVANNKEVSGVILASHAPITTFAESHVIFIDKGSDDGVKEGNMFTVVQNGDGLTAISIDAESVTATGDMPLEPVANLLVVDVRPKSSSALILKSVRELRVGDRVEMKVVRRPAGAGGDVQ